LILGAADDRFVGCQRPGIVAWVDRHNRHIVVCVERSEDLPLYDLGKPLLFPLLLWHGDRGMEVIHACLISKDGRGVLLAGRGGIGKSTSALTCIESGFGYLGDDYIALESAADGSFRGHSLYSSTWLMADNVGRFPQLAPHVIYAPRPDREKSLVLLADVFPDRLGAVVPIHALLIPRVCGVSSPRLRAASKAEALFALAPKSLILLPSSGAKGLENLLRLAERVPCFWLEVGADTHAIPERVAELTTLG
jgi:hypothetical protein